MSARGGRARLIWQSASLVVLLASTWLVVEASLRDASTAIVSAGRTAFTVLGLMALTWCSAQAPSASKGTGYRWWQVVLLALTGVSAYTVLSTVAIGLAGPALPALALSLTPAVVLIAESVMLRTWPSARTIAGTAIAVAGAVVYTIPRLAGTLGDDVALGSLVALAAMFSMAFYGLYFSRTNRGYVGPMAPRILPIFAVGTIPLAAWAATDVAAGERVSWTALGMLVLLGIVIYVPAYLLQHRILLTGGPSYSALLGLAVPPLVGVSSALLQPTGASSPMQIAGMGLTLAGMALVIQNKLARSKEDTPAGATRARPSDA